MTDTTDLRSKHKELRARFFPTQPTPPVKLDRIFVAKDAEAPVPKDIKIDPVFEPMEAEEFARKLRRGEFPKSAANLRRLIEKLSIDLNVPYDDIMSGKRMIPIARARMYCYWYLRKKMKLGLTTIARIMGRDHSTVVSGIKRFEGNGRDRRLRK